MVIDGGMDIVVAWAALAVPVTMLNRVAAMDAVAATLTQPAQLLDVHMDELAGVGALIAADQLAGGPVQAGQPVEAIAA